MDASAQIERLLEKWQSSVAAGKTVSAEELCRDCPELVAELRAKIEAATPAPKQAGWYVLQEEIGRGGMGAVYRARDPEFQRPLAVKVMLADVKKRPDLEQRFWAEAKITGQLQHPGIPPIHHKGRLSDGRPFFAMELIEGQSLSQLLAASDEREVDSVHFLSIFEQVCQTMAYAHSNGVIHRDLKPGHVMLGLFGEVQILSWGLAKDLSDGGSDEQAADETSIVPSEIEGGLAGEGSDLETLSYMPPEQARGEIDELDTRSDVFGLGAILCVILTGRPPFDAESFEEASAKATRGDLSDAYDRLERSGADQELVKLAKWCLAPDKETRPRDASKVAEAVAVYQHRVQQRLREAELQRAAAEALTAEEKRRRRVWILLGAVALLAVVGFGMVTSMEARRRAEIRLYTEQIEIAVGRAEDRRASLHRLLADATPGGWRYLQDRPTEWRVRIGSALADLRNAKTLANRSGEHLASELWGRIFALETGLARDSEEREIALRLEKLRLESAVLEGTDFSHNKTKQSYAAELTDAGFPVLSESPTEVARLLKASPLRERLVVALEDWASVPQDRETAERLLQIARLVDPDDQRDRIRDYSTWQDATRVQQLAKSLRPGTLSPRMLYLIGTLLRDPAEAEAWLRDAQALYPRDFWINFKLGQLLTETKPVEAVGFNRAALVVRPNSAAVYNNLGLAQTSQGDLEAATTSLRRAIDIDPRFAAAHYSLGNVHLIEQDYDAAEASYRRALQIDPAIFHAHHGLGVVLEAKGDPAAAVEAYEKCLEYAPNHSPTQLSLGKAHLTLKDIARAIPAYEKAIELDPDNHLPHYGLGNCYRQREGFQQAIESYRRAIQLDDSFGYGYLAMADCLYSLGRYDEAVAAGERGLELLPQSDGSRAAAADSLKMYLAGQELDNDLKRFQQGEKPVIALRQVKLAQFCLLQKKLYAEAVTLYRSAFESDPVLRDDLPSAHRYNAVCAAISASAADELANRKEEQAAFREQARQWLIADLKQRAVRLRDGNAVESAKMRDFLRRWLTSDDLAPVRDESALAKLPDEERKQWRELWSQVQTVLTS